MIHTFKAVGQPMLLDVGSGAVHAIDDMAFDVLEMWNDHTPEEIRDALKEKYTAQELDEVIGELKQLEELGALNAPDNYDDVKQVTEPGVVKSMCLHAAHDCNLRCKYCFAATGDFCMGERKLLPYEVGKAAIDWLVAHSGKRVNLELDFFGGEPLMNFETVKKIVEYARSQEPVYHKKFRFTITTNGMLLTDDKIDFINREMSNVVLSIDGRKEVNDRMRPRVDGKGSYDKIIPMYKKLVDQRGEKEYYVRGTYTKYNLDFSDDVFALLDAGFDQISVEPVIADAEEPYAITEADLPRIFEEYERLMQKILDYEATGKKFNFFHFMLDLDQGPCAIKRLRGCGCGNEYVAITPDGDIYPCHQFVGEADYKMGNVDDGTFNREMKSDFAKTHIYSKPDCRNCWARFYCSGGCNANNYQFSGDVHKAHKLSCEIEKKRLECAIVLKAIRMDREAAKQESAE